MPLLAATEAGPDGPPAWPRPRPRGGTAVQVPPQPEGRMGLAGLCHRPLGEGCTAQNAGLCHRPLGEGCTAQNAGDTGVALLLSLALPRSGRSTPGSPSSCWALEWTFSASCPAQNSRLALASLPQPDLEVRSFRNAERQYPCARPFVLYHGLLGRA